MSHYGIQGQKWGIRRFQFENGSYTPEGKERYGRGSSSDGKTGGLFSKNRNQIPEVHRKNIKKDFDYAMQNAKYRVDLLKKKNSDLIAKRDSLIMKYGDYLKKQKLSDKDRDQIWDEIHEYAKDYEPYEEKDFFYEDCQTAIDSAANKIVHNAPKDLIKEAEDIESEIESFRNEIYEISKPVFDKYEDKYIKDLDSNDGGYYSASYAVNQFLQSEFKSPFVYPTMYASSWDSVDRMVYYSKAFSYDIENFIDRIGKEYTIDEYYKRYGYGN